MNTKKTAAPSAQGWGRYFVRGSELRSADKEQLQLVVHWLRQLLALLCGLACGLVPLLGLVGLAGFMILNLGVIYYYYSKYLMLDETEIEGKDLLQEGIMPSFATFVVTWITIYNLKLSM